MPPAVARPRGATQALDLATQTLGHRVQQSPAAAPPTSAPLPLALHRIRQQTLEHAAAKEASLAEAEAHEQLAADLDDDMDDLFERIRMMEKQAGFTNSLVTTPAPATAPAPPPAPALPPAAAMSPAPPTIKMPASALHGFHFYTPPSIETVSCGSDAQLTRMLQSGAITATTMIDRFSVDTDWISITSPPDFRDLLVKVAPAAPLGPPPASQLVVGDVDSEEEGEVGGAAATTAATARRCLLESSAGELSQSRPALPSASSGEVDYSFPRQVDALTGKWMTDETELAVDFEERAAADTVAATSSAGSPPWRAPTNTAPSTVLEGSKSYERLECFLRE